MPIGAHVSTAGGLSNSIGRAQALGAECIQIFLSAPRRLQHPKHTDEEVAAFTTRCAEAAIAPAFAHATYLINLASDDPGLREASIANLCATAQWCDRIGLAGVVVHVGSGKAQSVEDAERHVASAVEQLLAQGSVSGVILENSAGSGDTLGARFEQIGALFDRLGRDPRLALCLDTAHTFASGYDLRVHDGIERALEEIERYVGLERLWLIHANDSKVDLGSAVDRHENIGHGLLGEEAFVRMLAHPKLRDLPWVIEAPGFDGKGPDLPNVQALKRLDGRPVA